MTRAAKEKRNKAVARLFNEQEYSVEVHCPDSEDFPFNKFRKKPSEHSGKYLGGDSGTSWANFSFARLVNAKRFAVRAREKDFGARVFKLKVKVHFDYELI